MRFIFAFLALLMASPVSAATYQIDVTGAYDKASFAYAYDPIAGRNIGMFDFDPSDPRWTDPRPYLTEAIRSTTGSALFVGNVGGRVQASNCSGLLFFLCRPGYVDFDIGNIFYNGFPDSYGRLAGLDLTFANDWSGGSFGNVRNIFGFSATGSVNSLSIAQVPLPAGGLLLLSGLVGLIGLRRLRNTASARTI